MSETPAPPRAVFARHAASLLLWREGARGLEVLMGVRGAGARFAPNRLVFPGGAVDPGDGVAPAASEPDPATLAVLMRAARGRLARGLVMAAARELEEETGLTLGRPPALAGLRYLCRALTPPGSPIRFNARFFVAEAALATGTATDGDELGAVGFYDVSEAIGAGVMGVTREVLLRLEAYVADRSAPVVPMAYRNRRWMAD